MNGKISPFLSRLEATAKDTDDLLDQLLSGSPAPGELARPARLIEAIRYSSLGGGKRFRPFLVVECAGLFRVPRQQALMTGAALECVHCYSLVHDDLPAMDDDDLRRGQPTAHKKFDEATAILVGALARASGIGGMVGGQMLDLAAEGRFIADGPQRLGEEGVLTLQAMKTGALLRFACLAGGVLGLATPQQRKALERYGAAVGQAFQIADDLLDVEGDTALVGKQTGKDAKAGKATMVDILGADAAKARLRDLVTEAEQALAPFGDSAAVLIEGARFVADRRM